MDSVAIRTAAKTFNNASHGERGRNKVLQMAVSSVGRHAILRALIKMRQKTCDLAFFAAFVKQLVDDCLEKTGYPDLGGDREVIILGESHRVSSRALASKMVQSTVDLKVTYAELQNIPGNTLRLLSLVQKDLSIQQFCAVILEELERRHMYRYNRHFWTQLESEYTRDGALEVIRAGFEAEGRCFRTGVYAQYCHCEECRINARNEDDV